MHAITPCISMGASNTLFTPPSVSVTIPPPSPPGPSGPAVRGTAETLIDAIPEALWQGLARHQLLLPLLRQEVIAAAVQHETLDQEQRTDALRVWAQRHNLRSQEDLQAHLRRNGLSEADAAWQAELPLRIARHCGEHFAHRAEQRFLARKNQLDQVIYSLLRVEDAALAKELYLRIAEGEADFAELAALYAKGPERSTRGVVGPVPLLQAHPVLAEVLRTSRPGQLHPPLQIDQWWLVVRLETLRSSSFDDGIPERMAQELFEEWVEEEVGRLVAARRAP